MITVKDLKKILEKLDDDLPVLICDAEWGYGGVSNPKVETNIEIVHHFSAKKPTKIKKALVIG